MKSMITKLQKDIDKLQKTIHKEGNDLLDRVKQVDLKDNIEGTRKEIEKALYNKLRKLEPAYHNFMKELRKNARKAGIDIDKIESELKDKAEEAGQRLKSVRKSGSKAAGKKKVKKAKKAVAKKAGGVKKSLTKTLKKVKKVTKKAVKKTTKKSPKKAAKKVTKKKVAKKAPATKKSRKKA